MPRNARAEPSRSVRWPAVTSALTNACERLQSLRSVYFEQVDKVVTVHKLGEDKAAAIVGKKVIEAVTLILRSVEAELRGVFREYRHAPKDRRLLEQALQMAGRSRAVMPKDKAACDDKVVRTIADSERAITIALSALDKGDVCEKNECAISGCFRVVNTGHFDEQTMAHAGKLADQAAALLHQKGFEDLCYGDIFVTKQISSDPKGLAFWMPGEDRMYVRAKSRRGEESIALGTFMHELGHRLLDMFFSPQGQRLVKETYRQWMRKKAEAVYKSGEEIVVGYRFRGGRDDREYEVEGLSYQRGEVVVQLHPVDAPEQKYRGSKEAILGMMGARRVKGDPFPSRYATKSSDEMFSELFRVYMTGEATREQLETVEHLIATGYRNVSAPPGQVFGRSVGQASGRRR